MQRTIVFALFCDAFIGGVSSAHGEAFHQKKLLFLLFPSTGSRAFLPLRWICSGTIRDSFMGSD